MDGWTRTGYLCARIEAVASPRLCENVARTGHVWLDLLAQLADENAQVFILFDGIPAPDGGEQGAMRENFSRMAQEVNHQVILFRRQVYFSAFDDDAACFEINTKVSG